MSDALHILLISVFEPAYSFLFNGHVRNFWIYVLTGLVIAYAAHTITGDKRTFFEAFFSRDAWLSQSALNDYGILFINPVLKILLFTGLLAYFNKISDLAVHVLRDLGVSGKVSDGDAFLVAAVLTVTLFIVDDFMRWFTHYLQHKIPVLWEFHKVHHSAEVLNFATAERFHPFDSLVAMTGMTLSLGLVNGVFIAFFGDELTPLTLGGANVLWFGFNVIGGVLRHSPIWVSFGSRLEHWIISPAMHHIHHSDDPRHFDKNMGGSLAIWDRMFGTLYVPDGQEVSSYGIGEENSEYRTLWALYSVPVTKALRHIRPASAGHEELSRQ